MFTAILDDDPTGTQSATGVDVVLDLDEDVIRDVAGRSSSCYLLTNTRAYGEAEATALVARLRDILCRVAEEKGEDLRIILRGDSTLRGHVFAEAMVLTEAREALLFVPAFPDGGRVTVGGIHYVTIGGERIPAARSEYAGDPVFPFRSSSLADYVREKSELLPIPVPLETVRAGGLAGVLASAPAGSAVVPDAETNADIELIAEAFLAATAAGARVVVRSAAPLAAAIAAVTTRELLPAPLVDTPARTLVVCGSHTEGATRQLERLQQSGARIRELDTAASLRDPCAHGASLAEELAADIRKAGIGVLASERTRLPEHGTLRHGKAVMDALVAAVAATFELLGPELDAVVAKGGITSADVASAALAAGSAHVRGQARPGISVWDLPARTPSGTPYGLLYVVVPGNVGDDGELLTVVRALGHDGLLGPR